MTKVNRDKVLVNEQGQYLAELQYNDMFGTFSDVIELVDDIKKAFRYNHVDVISKWIDEGWKRLSLRYEGEFMRFKPLDVLIIDDEIVIEDDIKYIEIETVKDTFMTKDIDVFIKYFDTDDTIKIDGKYINVSNIIGMRPVLSYGG